MTTMTSAGRPKYEINLLLNGLVSGFRDIGLAVISPQREITKIVKSHTNSQMAWPVSWLELQCGHTAKALFVDRNGNEHDDNNHVAKPGAMMPCGECLRYAEKLAKLCAMRDGSMQHSRFRHRDSRGFGAGDHYLYGHAPNSPSGVRLVLSIEDTPEAVVELRRVTGTSSLSPTEGR